MIKLTENEKTVIDALNSNDFVSFDTMQKGLKLIDKLLNAHCLDILDVEEDGLNYIECRENVRVFLVRSLKADLYQPSAVQDFDMLLHSDDDVYYINGYARVQHVTASDIACELDDVIDYINDHQ